MSRALVLGFVLTLGCTNDPTHAGPFPPVALEVISGAGQSQLAGYPLDESIILRAVDSQGSPVANVEVTFETLPPGADLEASATQTSGDGTLSASWRLAPRLGNQSLRATMPRVSGTNALTVLAQATGAAVRAISGDATKGMCAVYLDGRLGCFMLHSDPPLIVPVVANAEGPERYRDVAVQGDYGCAITEAGRVRCFQLLAGSAALIAWVELGGGHPPLVQLTARRVGGSDPTYCALDEVGSVWCWGRNATGIVGDGTTNDAAVPLRVAIPAALIEVSLDTRAGCALTTIGATWCWGEGARERLTDPAGTGPSRVITDLRFTTIDLSNDNALCGRTSAGLLHCWGRSVPWASWPGGSGLLGSTGPVNPVASYTGASSVAGQERITFVTTADGVGAWWGDITMLDTPSEPHAASPRAPKYPFGFTTLIQREESRTTCGRIGPADPAICFMSEMFFSSPAHVVDPKRVIGFGVPGP